METLREQLKSLQTQMVAGKLPSAGVTPALSGATAPKPLHAVADAPTGPTSRLQTAAGEVSQKLPTEASCAPTSAHVAAPPPASTSLTIDCAEPPISEEDLQQMSSLSFTGPAKLASKSAADSRSAVPNKGLLLAASLLLTAGAAWYQNLLPWLPLLRNVSPSTARGIAAPIAPHAPQKTANAQADFGKSTQISRPLTTQPHGHDASQPAPLGTAKPSTLVVPERPATIKSVPEMAAYGSVEQEKPGAAASGPTPSSKVALASVAPRSEGPAFVPPKLIKSVRAIVSPDALRDFATGNSNSVTLDALVDASGHVKSMKALSGSASLQRAAMEALKQYRYEPARQRGSPVPAHVTVKIKFLFEP